jgi:Ca2+-binding RTX toxin-like protein
MVYAYSGISNDTIFGHEGRVYLRGDGDHDIILGLAGNDDLSAMRGAMSFLG